MEHDKHYGPLLTKEEIRHYSLNHKPPLVNPESVIDFEIQLQPESFDLTVLDLHTFKTAGEIGFRKKKPSETEPMNINKLVEENGPYFLKKGHYKVKYNEEIHFPNNIYGFVLPKSILTRSDSDLKSAHWDTGYNGKGEGLLVVGEMGLIITEPNPRIGQMMFYWTNPTELYDGTFQHEGLKK